MLGEHPTMVVVYDPMKGYAPCVYDWYVSDRPELYPDMYDVTYTGFGHQSMLGALSEALCITHDEDALFCWPGRLLASYHHGNLHPTEMQLTAKYFILWQKGEYSPDIQ